MIVERWILHDASSGASVGRGCAAVRPAASTELADTMLAAGRRLVPGSEVF